MKALFLLLLIVTINSFAQESDSLILSKIQKGETVIPYIKYSPKAFHSGLPKWFNLEKLYLDYSDHGLLLDSIAHIVSFDVKMKDDRYAIDTLIHINGNLFSKEFHEILLKCSAKAHIEFLNIKIFESWRIPTEYFYDEYIRSDKRRRLEFEIE